MTTPEPKLSYDESLALIEQKVGAMLGLDFRPPEGQSLNAEAATLAQHLHSLVVDLRTPWDETLPRRRQFLDRFDLLRAIVDQIENYADEHALPDTLYLEQPQAHNDSLDRLQLTRDLFLIYFSAQEQIWGRSEHNLVPAEWAARLHHDGYIPQPLTIEQCCTQARTQILKEFGMGPRSRGRLHFDAMVQGALLGFVATRALAARGESFRMTSSGSRRNAPRTAYEQCAVDLKEKLRDYAMLHVNHADSATIPDKAEALVTRLETEIGEWLVMGPLPDAPAPGFRPPKSPRRR